MGIEGNPRTGRYQRRVARLAVMSGFVSGVRLLAVLLSMLFLSQPLPGWAASRLTRLVEATMRTYFSQDAAHRMAMPNNAAYRQLIRTYRQQSPYRKPMGVFVTLSRQGRSRACWGSVYPQQGSVEESTVYATLGALTKEYRYKPISASEWTTLKSQVTVIRAVEPIDGLQGQNPLSDGLMLRAGGRSGIILPGEARDAYYQLVQCWLKAGVRPGEPYQLYRMVADVYQ